MTNEIDLFAVSSHVGKHTHTQVRRSNIFDKFNLIFSCWLEKEFISSSTCIDKINNKLQLKDACSNEIYFIFKWRERTKIKVKSLLRSMRCHWVKCVLREELLH